MKRHISSSVISESEVRHRAQMQTCGMSLGDMLSWAQDPLHADLLRRLEAQICQLQAGELTSPMISAFWGDFKHNPALMSWFKYVGSAWKLLLKSGLAGDQYSIPVLRLIIKEALMYLPADINGRHDPDLIPSSSLQTGTPGHPVGAIPDGQITSL
ncbi:hypothetical protein BCV78_27080 [Salmonella enterica]|nr:hypothetical protein [Salmonella enterica]EAS2028852.1 hypothetical protein [Salmonella enterica]EAU0260322.1 hypothetical protein [Salmonella enterica]EBQ3428548.1 hypothetical protein [Salmonella enterica]